VGGLVGLLGGHGAGDYQGVVGSVSMSRYDDARDCATEWFSGLRAINVAYLVGFN